MKPVPSALIENRERLRFFVVENNFALDINGYVGIHWPVGGAFAAGRILSIGAVSCWLAVEAATTIVAATIGPTLSSCRTRHLWDACCKAGRSPAKKGLEKRSSTPSVSSLVPAFPSGCHLARPCFGHQLSTYVSATLSHHPVLAFAFVGRLGVLFETRKRRANADALGNSGNVPIEISTDSDSP